jgi:hypothetical protein
VNDGDIDSGGSVRIAAPLTGVGNIMSSRSVLELADRVDGSETISLNHTNLVLDKPTEFSAGIELLSPAASFIELIGVSVTNSEFLDHHLRLLDGTQLVADLHMPTAEVIPDLSIRNEDGNAILMLGFIAPTPISMPSHLP